MRALLAVLLFALAGCVTPVIPLPPPDPATFSLTISADGQQVALKGPSDPGHAGELIFVLNQRTGEGTITRTSPSDGSFETSPLPARDRDRLDLWFARGPDEVTSDISCAVVDLNGKRLDVCQ